MMMMKIKILNFFLKKLKKKRNATRRSIESECHQSPATKKKHTGEIIIKMHVRCDYNNKMDQDHLYNLIIFKTIYPLVLDDDDNDDDDDDDDDQIQDSMI